MCRALEVSPAGYYRWRGRKPSARAEENERLMKQIKAAYAESRGNDGSPKIQRCLRRDGVAVNHKRVERLMRENGLRAKRVRKIKRTTDSRHTLPVAENVLARQFSAERPNEVWTSDITYVWTAEGWLYLVVFLDLYSRLVVGWAVSESLAVGFVEQAFLHGQARRGAALVAAGSFRPWEPIRERGFHGTTCGVGLFAKHEPQGQLLGQRRNGELLRHPEE